MMIIKQLLAPMLLSLGFIIEAMEPQMIQMVATPEQVTEPITLFVFNRAGKLFNLECNKYYVYGKTNYFFQFERYKTETFEMSSDDSKCFNIRPDSYGICDVMDEDRVVGTMVFYWHFLNQKLTLHWSYHDIQIKEGKKKKLKKRGGQKNWQTFEVTQQLKNIALVLKGKRLEETYIFKNKASPED